MVLSLWVLLAIMDNFDSYNIHFHSEQIDFGRLILINTEFHNVIGIYIVYIHRLCEKR